MLSVAILRGSLATRMDSVYTLASSAASHQRCHGLSVCMCVVGGGASLRKRKGHRDREREHVDKLGYVPLSQDNFTIYLSTETLKAPRSSDLEKLSGKILPPLPLELQFSNHKSECREPNRGRLGAEICRPGGSHFRASSLHGGIVVQSPVDEHVVGSCGQASLCSPRSHCAKTRHKIE